MALPHHYLIALVSPAGRLGQFHFAFLAVVIAFAHLYLHAKMVHMPANQPWNIYSIALLALIWCKFCILSRRLHDTGSNGFIAVPLVVCAALFYVFLIDPSTTGPEALRDPNIQAILAQGVRIPRCIFIVAFIYCIRAGGESGPNGYGPEFGDSADLSGANSALDRKQTTTMPVHSYKKLGGPDLTGWGERRRPAGFGRR